LPDGVTQLAYLLVIWQRPSAAAFLALRVASGCAVFLRHARAARRDAPFEKARAP
jgi:hypothetical protein